MIGTDEVFVDLLKVAETVAKKADLGKALYNGEVVTVIRQNEILSQIVREGDDLEFDSTSVRNTELKPYGKVRLPHAVGKPMAAPTRSMMDLEAYVESVGCRITVEARTNEFPQVIAQYEADVKRPITPTEEKYIIPVENRLKSFPPEWRTTFKAPSSAVHINYPFDTVGSGEWRVNKRDFARYLISKGFTLGVNKPKAVAASAAPPAAAAAEAD